MKVKNAVSGGGPVSTRGFPPAPAFYNSSPGEELRVLFWLGRLGRPREYIHGNAAVLADSNVSFVGF